MESNYELKNNIKNGICYYFYDHDGTRYLT